MNSNHMPMTLCAISGLGGHFDNLLEFQEEYKKKLHETTPEDPSPSWRLGIGRSESYPSLFAWFRDQVVEKARHRQAGAAWAERFDMPASPDDVVVCAGTQHALCVALMAIAQARSAR